MYGYSTCKIVIGTKAKKIKSPKTDVTHEWIAYVRGPKNIIKNVQFKLHESFANNVIVTEYPFEIKEQGWGEFTIQIKITLMNDDKISTSHFLKLHGEDEIIVNETTDEIVYKGIENEVVVTEEEELEYKTIQNAIDEMLKLIKEEE